MPQLRNIFRVGAVLIFALFFAGFFILNINLVEAIIGPSQGPGDGGGSLSVDVNRNLGFNTSVVGTSTGATPPFGNFSKVFMIAATSSPPGVGLRSVASGCPPEGCSGQQLYPATWVWRLTPWGFMELVNATDSTSYNQGPVITFGGGSAYSRRVIVGNFYSSTSSMSEAFNVIGNMQATQNVIAKGSFSGTTLSGNVASGLFGSLQGGGNFAFGNTLTVGTSTPSNTPANGLYVYGNVGIGTATPDYKLKVVGSSVAMGTNAGDFTLNIQQGGAGGDLFLQLDGSTKVTVNNNGNVGIGNTLSSSIDTNAGVVRTVIGSATGATQGVLDLVTNTAGVSSGIGLLQFGNYNISGTEKRIAIIEGQTNGAVNSGKLNFYTASAGSLGIKAVIDANGNMGIGTTNPAYKLDVGGAVNATAFYQNGSPFVGGGGGGSAEGWSRTTTTGAVYLTTSTDSVGIGTATPGYKLQVNGTSSAPVASFYAGGDRLSLKHDVTADTFQLYHYDDTAVAEQKIALGLGNYLVVNSNGNVGIGTTGPKEKLNVQQGNVYLSGAPGSALGSSAGIIKFGFANVDYNWPIAAIEGIQSGGGAGVIDGNDQYGHLIFKTASSNTDPTEKMRIDANGNIGISTTTPSYKLDVVGTSQFSQPVIVGTPTANSHAATKNYVDSVLTGGASDGSFSTLAVAGTSTLATTAGGVGIGTTVPITKLQINKSGQLIGQTTPNGAFVISNLSSGNGGLELGVDNTSLAYIQSRNITSNTNYNLLLNPSGGNVGIGTTGPGAKLEIYGGHLKVNTDNYFGSGTGNSQNTYIFTGGTGQIGLRIDGRTGQTADLQTWNIDSGSTNVAKITAAGGAYFGSNVGIGTTGPGSRFDVQPALRSAYAWRALDNDSTVAAGLYVGSTGAGTLDLFDAAGIVNTQISNTTHTYFNGAGNVGVSTTTPNYKLDVVGGGQFSQPVIVGTPTQTTHATTKSYVDSMFTGSGQWTTSGGLVYLTSTTQNVGIGTTSPVYKLDVQATGASAIYRLGTIDNTSAGLTALTLATGNGTAIANHVGSIGVIANESLLRFMVGSNASPSVANFNSFTRMVINSSGNVGIGTTGPGVKLQTNISDTSTTLAGTFTQMGMGIVQTDTTNNNWANIMFSDDGSTPISVFGTQITDHTNNYGDFAFATRGSGGFGERVRITSNGNVGIGTTAPDFKLDISGNVRIEGSNILYFGGTGTNDQLSVIKTVGGVTTIGGNGFSITNEPWTAAPPWFYINSSGNVGIATTTPLYRLDVVGTAQFSQPVIVGTPTANTHATTKSYVDSMFSGSGQWTTSGSNIYSSLAGNVGIGTNSPGAKLDVRGNMILRGGLYTTDNIINYEYDSLFAANKKWTVTNEGFNGVGNLFDARPETANSCSALPCSITIDMGGAQHYWYGLSLSFNWGTGYGGSSSFKIEKYYDPAQVGACNSWATVEDVSGFSGSRYVTTNNMSNYTCQYKITFNNIVGSTNTIHLGEIAAYRFYYDNEGPMAKRMGDTFYGGLNFSGVTSDITTPSGEHFSIMPGGTGNVGIGTTGPGTTLHIKGTGWIDNTVGSSLLRLESTDTVGAGIALKNTNGNYWNIYNGGTASWAGQGKLAFVYSDGVTGATGPKMVIDTNGNVGIGTTGPGAKLEVDTITGTTGILVTGTDTNGYADLDIKSVGTTGSSRLFFSDTAAQSGFIKYDHSANSMLFGTSGANVVTINTSGNVGIATTTPQYKLTVSGTGSFDQPIFVGTPTNTGHAATKSYVDSIVGGGAGTGSFATLSVTGTSTLNGNIWFGGAAYSNLNMNGNNIVGVNKITAVMIDPLYRIDNTNYSTYGISTAGAVYEEYIGRGRLTAISNSKFQISNKLSNESNVQNSENSSSIKTRNLKLNNSEPTQYEYIIDFSKVEKGSDLWLWYNVVDFGNDTVNAVVTPIGGNAQIYYTVNGTKLIFTADASVEFSYRLSGKRHDWKEWPIKAKDQNETPSFILQSK